MSDVVGPPATWCSQVTVDDRAYVFVPATEAFLALNESATRVWVMCDGTRTRAELVAALVDEHGGDRNRVAEVVSEVLGLLTAAGLLTAVARPA